MNALRAPVFGRRSVPGQAPRNSSLSLLASWLLGVLRRRNRYAGLSDDSGIHLICVHPRHLRQILRLRRDS